MNREDLIKKWLDHSLDPQEFEAFKALDDYEELVKLADGLKQFKAEDYNADTEYERLQKVIKAKTSKNWLKPILRIAAILMLGLGLYYYASSTNDALMIVSTSIAQKDSLVLPDQSKVFLNAKTSVDFNPKSWVENRALNLKGEAYFRVAKGSKFAVNTQAGTVTVLGTAFNVKVRDQYFEVLCYAGLVQVEYEGTTRRLHPGDGFLVIENKLIPPVFSLQVKPTWVDGESAFLSQPLHVVISELERQYDYKILTENIDTLQLFTGTFSHHDIDLAIKAISIPLNLSHSKTDRRITLKSD